VSVRFGAGPGSARQSGVPQGEDKRDDDQVGGDGDVVELSTGEPRRQLKLAFSTLAFPRAPLSEVVAFGLECGYEGIELRLIDGELIDPDMSRSDRERVRQAVGRLPVVAVDSSVRVTGDDPVSQIVSFLELANEWSAPVVRVFGGQLPESAPERSEAMRRAAAALTEAAGVAERLGVGIGVETHDSFSGSAVVAELLALVGAPQVGAVWDSHHPYRVGEIPTDVYANIGARLLLAQVKDALRSEGDPSGWRLVLLGEGEVPVREMFAILHESDYGGVISVEWEKAWHPEIEEPEVALPQHIKLLQRWRQELATV
jgi:sugar phosphate isomerase/epimerase